MTSYGQSFSYHCDGCGNDGKLFLWLVVDLEERADLAAAIRDGSIRRPPCDVCGARLALHPSLMVSRPDKRPQVLFSPDPAAPVSTTQQMQFSHHLLNRGKASVPDQRVAVLPLEVMPIAADRDIDDDLQRRRVGALLALNPEMQRYAAWLDSCLASEAEGRLKQAMNELGQASTTAELRSVFQSWPELLSDQADALLTAMVEIAEKDHPEAGPMFRRRRMLVRRVRESGLDPVLPPDPS